MPHNHEPMKFGEIIEKVSNGATTRDFQKLLFMSITDYVQCSKTPPKKLIDCLVYDKQRRLGVILGVSKRWFSHTPTYDVWIFGATHKTHANGKDYKLALRKVEK